MHSPNLFTASWPTSEAPQPGTIDWMGLTVVDPTPEPPVASRLTPAARDHEACLRSASRFYTQWGE